MDHSAGGQSGSASAPKTGVCANSPGQNVCDDVTLYQCDANGDASAHEDCQSAMLCAIGLPSGKCAVCNPGTFKCDGATLNKCGDDGQYTMTDMCSSPALCKEAAGACTEMVCTPNSKSCGSDGSLQTCSADGSKIASSVACPNTCDAKNGKCFDCMPGSKMCVGDQLQTCSASGMQSTTTCGGTTPRCLGNKCVACVADNDCPQTNECIPNMCDKATNRCVPSTAKPAGTRCGTNMVCNDLGLCTGCGNGMTEPELGENCDPKDPGWVNSGDRCDKTTCRITDRIYTEPGACSQNGNACWPNGTWACAAGALECTTPCEGFEDRCVTNTFKGKCLTVTWMNRQLIGCFIPCQNSIDCPPPMVCTNTPDDLNTKFCGLQEFPTGQAGSGGM
jgi:hypothetical protein